MAKKSKSPSKKAISSPAPPIQTAVQERSVAQQRVGALEQGPGGGNSFVMWFASIADTFTKWGTLVAKRDVELRDFWHTESLLASAIYTVTASNSSFEWKLIGPPETTAAVQDILQMANKGKGWSNFIKKISIDLYTQDNGAFFEVIRATDSPLAPIIGINSLEALRCQRTGDPEIPVIFTDRNSVRHKMPWYSVVVLEEFPSPIEEMFDVQYCAVTRVLRMAQIMRDIAIYRGEKIGGRFTEAIHIVGGVSQSAINDVRKRQQELADNQHLVRYLEPLIIGSLDPQATPTSVTIEMKALPEGFNISDEFEFYISQIALGLGRDFQEFAPLPRGQLGSGAQSEVLHLKSRGKGPATFMDLITQSLNAFVMPGTVTFEFVTQDIDLEQREAKVKKTRAEERKIRIESGEIDPIIARQIAQDQGDLDARFLELLGEQDLTPDMMLEQQEQPRDLSDTVLAEKLIAKAWNDGESRPLREIFGEQKWMKSIDGKMTEFHEALAHLLQANKIRQEQAADVVANMQFALEELKESKYEAPSPISAEAIVKKAVELMKLQQLFSPKRDVVRQKILKRDQSGRVKVIRKWFSSGDHIDYEVTGRDANGRMIDIQKIN